MFGECHGHIFMNGTDYRQAVKDHRDAPNEALVREHLAAYREAGVSYVRDGGDHFGASVLAREIAGEYGIEYRTPVFAVHREGHYGGIVGKSAADLAEYRALLEGVKRQRGDFVKIMVSGIMDYGAFGKLSEPPLEPDWIREMIHIAHAEGFAVMAHANGREAVQAAVLAGADSIEHGNYIDGDCIQAMAEQSCVFVPTIVTTANLIGCGRYDDAVLQRIFEMECENLRAAYRNGVCLALGSDAGAYRVLHGQGVADEYHVFREVLAPDEAERARLDERLRQGEQRVREKFRRE